MNRKLSDWLIRVFGVVITLFDLLPSVPLWVKQWVTLIAGVLIIDYFVIWIVSYRRSNKLKLMKPLLLPQLHIKIDYDNPIEENKCNFCIPVFDKKYLTSNDIDFCLREDLNSINENIKTYNRQAEAFIDELNLKTANYVKQKIPKKWDITNPPEPMRYYTKNIYSEIGGYVKFYNEKRYEKRSPFGLQKYRDCNKEETSRWKLKFFNTIVASDNETEIDEIQKTIDGFFDTAVIGMEFKRLNKFFEQIEREHELYKKQIEPKIKNIEMWILLRD